MGQAERRGLWQLLGCWDGVVHASDRHLFGGTRRRGGVAVAAAPQSLQSPTKAQTSQPTVRAPTHPAALACVALCCLPLPPYKTLAGASGFVIEPCVAQEFRLPAFGDLSIAGVAGKVSGRRA